MLTPREKSPLPENVPRGGSNPRRCGQRAQALPTELFRPTAISQNNKYNLTRQCLIHSKLILRNVEHKSFPTPEGGGGGGGRGDVDHFLSPPLFPSSDPCCAVLVCPRYRLAGLVVKASASEAEDPGFESRFRRDFFRVESYQ